MKANQRSAKIIFFFILTESKIHFIKTYVKDIIVIKYSFKTLTFKVTSDIQQGRATNTFIKYHLNTLLYGWTMMLNGPHRVISPTSLFQREDGKDRGETVNNAWRKGQQHGPLI